MRDRPSNCTHKKKGCKKTVHLIVNASRVSEISGSGTVRITGEILHALSSRAYNSLTYIIVPRHLLALD